jgi:proteasome accessory factor C
MRRDTNARLRRLLAVVPWVVEMDGPLVREVCERFSCSESELVEDLRLLFLCGLHPYTPDALIDVDIADGRVWIRYADYFSRPLRLSPAEGLALLVAGYAVLATPGADPSGPLARGLAKLGAVLGLDAETAVEVSLAGVPEEVTSAIDEAIRSGRRLEIDYYSYGRDQWTRRTVDPLGVGSAQGQWYLSAYCHMATDERLFRLDRIRGVTVLDSSFDPPPGPPAPPAYIPRDDDPRLTLELAPGARWVVEQYPTEAVEELAGGALRVRLAVSNRAWLERLLLRLGSAARVVDGDGEGVDARAAAQRVLARYR